MSARFVFKVSRNPAHATVRVYAATGGTHLGYAGELTFRLDEWEQLDRHLRRGPTNRQRSIDILEVES